MSKLSIFLGIVGFIIAGFRGAMIGFFLGALLDELYFKKPSNQTSFGRNPSRAYSRNQQAVDFELNMLKLSAFVIKADGNTSQKELDFVRMEFVRMFGKERANRAFETFRRKKNQGYSIAQVCAEMRQGMPIAVRSQLLHYLFKIAQVDDVITTNELHILEQIAKNLRITQREFFAIRAMFTQQQRSYSRTSSRATTSSYKVSSAYAILEIDATASDAEVKKAYRSLVKKYHPDKLQHLGKVHVKAATEKFKKIQESYEIIRKKRGMK